MKNVKVFKERLKKSVPVVLSGTLIFTVATIGIGNGISKNNQCRIYTTSDKERFTYVIENIDDYERDTWELKDYSEIKQDEKGNYYREVSVYQNSNCSYGGHTKNELEDIVFSNDLSGREKHFMEEHYVGSEVEELEEVTEEKLSNNSDYMYVMIDTVQNEKNKIKRL